jgi:carbonic anhydrase
MGGIMNRETGGNGLDHLLANNREWAEARLAEDPDFFEELASGQAPSVLLIGCSDSRKCINAMLGTRPGDIFVHRNIGNQVSPADTNAQAVLEFAINHLEVQHVVIKGHTRCGGMKASLAGYDQGMVGTWLRDARGLVARNARELNEIPDEGARADRLSELNVIAQAENVLKSNAYRGAREAGKAPEVHGWIFELETGLVRPLELPKDRWVKEELL